MPDPIQLTPDALDSLLLDLDGEAFTAFVADLYERGGRETERRGTVVTAVTPDGDRERLLVWTDDRSRIERLLGTDSPDPDVEAIDAVVSRDRDAAAATAIAEAAGVDHVGTADLHGRLLYAMDRETCRDLCHEHLGRAVEPRPAPEPEPESGVFGALSRSRIALAAVVVCGLLVVGAAGLPGSGTPGGNDTIPGVGTGSADPPGSGPVTPVGGGPGSTPTATSAPPPTPSVPPSTPSPTAPTPPPPDGLEMLEPCPDEERGFIICLPPRPLSLSHETDVTAGSNVRINGTFTNPYDSEFERGLVGIEVPLDWRLQALSGATFDEVGNGFLPINGLEPGESRNVSWAITPAATAGGGLYNVTVVSEWVVPGYEGPTLNGSANTDADRFRLRENVTYRVSPAECRNVDPCSLLSGAANGSASFEVGSVVANATNTAAGVLYNPHDRPITNGTITLEPPNAEWDVTPVNGTTFGTLAPGASRPIAWNLSVPGSADCAREYTLRGSATYHIEGSGRVTVPLSFVASVTNENGFCLLLE
jgi:hypothetical protein